MPDKKEARTGFFGGFLDSIKEAWSPPTTAEQRLAGLPPLTIDDYYAQERALREMGPDLALGVGEGMWNTGKGLVLLGVEGVSQAAQGGIATLLSSPFQLAGIPEPPPVKKIRERAQDAMNFSTYLPKDLQGFVQPRPDNAWEAVMNVVEATGMPTMYNEYLSANIESTKLETLDNPQANNTGVLAYPTAHAYALARTIADVSPLGDLRQVMQASMLPPESRAREMGKAAGQFAVSFIPFAGIAGKLLGGGAAWAADLNKVKLKGKGGVTLADLQRINANTKHATLLTEAATLRLDKLQSVLETETKMSGNPQVYMNHMLEMGDEILPRVMKELEKHPDLVQSEALAKVLEAGEIPEVSIQRWAATNGTDYDTAAKFWVESKASAIELLRSDRTVVAKDLLAFKLPMLRAFKDAQLMQGNIEAIVNHRAQQMQKRYATTGYPGVFLDAFGNIPARATLATKLTGPLTAIRDTYGQAIGGAVDLWEKSMADTMLSAVESAPEIAARTKALFKKNTVPVLKNRTAHMSVAADTMSGYMAMFSPKQHKIITDAIQELPSQSVSQMGIVHPDTGRLTYNLGFREELKLAGKTFAKGKELISSDLTLPAMRNTLAGADLIANDGVVRLMTGLRTYADNFQRRMFFAGELNSQANRYGLKGIEGFMEELRKPNHDPYLDVIWEKASDHSKKRIFQMDPDATKTVWQSVLKIYNSAPVVTYVAPDYPRFLYNKFAYLSERTPMNLMAVLDPEFRHALGGGGFDEGIFYKAAREAQMDIFTKEFSEFRAGLPKSVDTPDAIKRWKDAGNTSEVYTDQYLKLRDLAGKDAQRQAAEHMARGVSGLMHMGLAINLRNSLYAGAKFYEMDFGSLNDPKPGLETLIESGILDMPEDPNARNTLDLRGYDPHIVPYLAYAHFMDALQGSGGDVTTALKHFDPTEVADMMVGLRNTNNSVFGAHQILLRALDPSTDGVFGEPGVAQFIGDEFIAPFAQFARLVTDPMAVAGEPKDSLDPFSNPMLGRTLQGLRPAFNLADTDIPLNTRKVLGDPAPKDYNVGFNLMSAARWNVSPLLERHLEGAHINLSDVVGPAETPDVAKQTFRLVNEAMTTRLPSGWRLADAMVLKNLEAEELNRARLGAAAEEGNYRERRARILEFVGAIREELRDEARLNAFMDNPANAKEYIKQGKSPMVRKWLDDFFGDPVADEALDRHLKSIFGEGKRGGK